MREKLIKILSVPIYPHELADPAEVVADYLLDNDVVPVVRCKNCKHYDVGENEEECWRWCVMHDVGMEADDFCSYGERKTQNDGRIR